MMDVVNTVITCVCALVMVIGFFGNGAAIITFCKRWTYLKSHELYVVFLITIDLILSFVQPTYALHSRGIIELSVLKNGFGCKFTFWLGITLNTQSAWLMVAVAIDRFTLIVVKPYSLMRTASKRNIFIVNCVIFLFASLSGALLVSRMADSNQIVLEGRCTVSLSSHKKGLTNNTTGLLVIIQLVIPGFILMILYTWMIIRLRKPVEFQENTIGIQIRKRRHWKIIRLFLIIVASFYVLTLPFRLFYIILSYTKDFNNRTPSTKYLYIYTSVFLLSYLNYCIDPFIYAGFCFKDIMRKIRNTLSQRWSSTIEQEQIHPQ